MSVTDVYAVGATRINVGTSAIIRVKASDYVRGYQMKIISGGGTLEIVPLPLALTGTSAVYWGTGYPVGATEVVEINGPAAYYLAATGATMVVGINLLFTAGITLIV